MKIKTDINNIIQLVLTIAGIIIVGIILSFKSFRIDLTAEKRYTLSPLTKDVLRNLDDIVYVKVYLEGNLNTQFKRLQISIKETLDEFRVYGKTKLFYEFVNPSESLNEKERQEVYYDLYEKGLKPINIKDTDEEGGEIEKIIFPGATIHYKNSEVSVNLLKNDPNIPAEENLNNSKQSLEYELINMIKNLTNTKVEKIAFIEGHGELDELKTGDITKELSNFFQVDRGIINGNIGILDEYNAIIIAKPEETFTEADKLALDQYLMQGGKILWFIDKVSVSLDSLYESNTIAILKELNIDDLLFKYGIRINPELVSDLQCNFIPINTALKGNKPEFTPTPWSYYPLLGTTSEHPIGAKVNLIRSKFASDISTVGDSTQRTYKTLIMSSKNTRMVKVPSLISLDEVRQQQNPKAFNQGSRPVAVLIEGKFESAFKNRMITQLLPAGYTMLKESKETQMLVVSDGDIIENETRRTPQGVLVNPLGFDPYTRQQFGNKEFVLNAINYMTGQEELIELRSREFKLRLFDKEKIKLEKKKWQSINIILPALLVIIFGILFNYYKVRKYTKD